MTDKSEREIEQQDLQATSQPTGAGDDRGRRKARKALRGGGRGRPAGSGRSKGAQKTLDPRGTPAFRFFKNGIFYPLLTWLWHPDIVGLNNVPDGGAILAANHLDAGDALALPGTLPMAIVMPAKKELFEGKSIGGRIVAWFLRATGQAPIDRAGGEAGKSNLGSLQDFLAVGGYVGIFPEGTRSPDGRLYRGHTGVARLTLATGKPVVPIAFINSKLQRNRLGLKIAMRELRIIIGEPMDFSDRAVGVNDVNVLRQVTNEVMAAIQQLTGQDYVDVYASKVKKGELSKAQADMFVRESPLAAAAAGDVPAAHSDAAAAQDQQQAQPNDEAAS